MRTVTEIPASGTRQGGKQRVAAYARVSSDNLEQLSSYQSQVQYYTQIISENDQWEYAGVYADEGITGTCMEKRSGFLQMLADCRAGKIDRILVKSLSRFARNTTDTLRIIHELKLLSVSILFEKENIDTAALSNEMLLTLYSMNAQRESLSISGNMRYGIRMKMKSGTFVSSSSPYGYEISGRSLVIKPDEAKVVRRIYDCYLSGQGMTDITDTLNAEDIGECISKRWHLASVRYILTNIAYTGDALWQKTFRTDTLPFRQVKNTGQLKQYHVQDHHQSIVSQEEFQRVQGLMASRRQTFSHAKPNGQSMLSKRIICGHCGKFHRRKVTNGKVYWVCRNHDTNKENCPALRIPEPALLDACVRMYNKLRHHYQHILRPMMEQLHRMMECRKQNNVELKELYRQIADLSEQALILNRLKSKQCVEPALYFSRMDQLTSEIHKLKSSKRHMMEACDDSLLEHTRHMIDVLEEGPAWITSMDEDLFNDLIERILVDAEGQIHIQLWNSLELREYIVKGQR